MTDAEWSRAWNEPREVARPTGRPLLEVRGVNAGYGASQILFGVDLHVDTGEQVLVFGPNGAGKSTLMKVLIGLLEPMDGSVRLEGAEIGGASPESIVRKGIGYVPQVDNVFASMSVQENLEMGALLVRAGRQQRIEEMYGLFPVLGDRRRQRAGTLSGGQRQMLAMARALVPEPRMLLLDEPTAGLAPSLILDTFETIARIRGELGTAVVMVEQHAKQALKYADRGYVLENGAVRFEGDAEDLRWRRDIEELYLGVQRT